MVEGRGQKSGGVQVVAYDVVSANDSPERDPRDWTVEGVAAEDEGATGGWAVGWGRWGGVGWSGRRRKGPWRGREGAEARCVLQLATCPAPRPAGGALKWQVLDQQAGVTFTQRHQLRAFWLTTPAPAPAAPATPAPAGQHPQRWVRLRLRITATADPHAANAVQLACWNLYGPQQPAPLPLPQPAPAPTAPAPAAAAALPRKMLAGSGGSGLQQGGQQQRGQQQEQRHEQQCLHVEACARRVLDAFGLCLLDAQQLELLRKVRPHAHITCAMYIPSVATPSHDTHRHTRKHTHAPAHRCWATWRRSPRTRGSGGRCGMRHTLCSQARTA